MKNSLKYILSAFVLAGSLVACSPDEFEGVNEAGIPQATSFGDKVKIQVDQELNQVSLTLDAPGVYPIWTITMPDGKKEEKTTTNGYTKIYTNSGDYKVTLKVGNRNGISDGEYATTFHLNNSIVDYTKYTTMLSKANWHMANKEIAHLACGESGSDGTNWWKAGEDEKASFGVYDNELTFTADFKYTFNPGDHGTIYVNKGVTVWPDYRNENEDYNVPVELQNSEYGLEVDGDDLYITFKKGTYFPYIANDYIWNTPRYKVVNLTTKKMTLLIDEPGVIAWQYILTTEATVEKAFTGFTYDQPNNIWKNIEVMAGGIYYADGGWAPYPNDGGATFTVSNQEASAVLPLSTASQWQAQFPIHTNVGPGSQYMTSAKHYDFSCVITSNKDLKNMTLKLVETGDNGVPGSLGIAYDANAVFYDNSTNLTAYEDYVFYLVDQPGVDIQDHVLQLVLDFGGNAEDFEVTVKNIVLIEHDLNTELGLLPKDDGGDEPGQGDINWDYNSANNLWKASEPTLEEIYIGDANWSPYPADQSSVELTKEKVLFKITPATDAQWKSQLKINTGITNLDPEKKYDFHCKMTANADMKSVTVKLCELGPNETPGSLGINYDANTVLYNTDTKLEAFEEAEVSIVAQPGIQLQDNPLMIVFDFGGNPENFEVEISEIIIQEHTEPVGPAPFDYNSEDNLWKASAPTLEEIYIGDANWSPYPADQSSVELTNEKVIFNITPATDAQWKSQLKINTGITDLDPEKKYDFHCKMTANADMKSVTVKLCELGPNETPGSLGINYDANTILYNTDTKLEAYEEAEVSIVAQPGIQLQDNPLMLVFDFGGNPESFEVEITEIVIRESK